MTINTELFNHEESEAITLRTFVADHGLGFLPLVDSLKTSPSVYIVKALGAKNLSGKIRVLDPEYLGDEETYKSIYEDVARGHIVGAFTTRHGEAVELVSFVDGIFAIKYKGTGLVILFCKF